MKKLLFTILLSLVATTCFSSTEFISTLNKTGQDYDLLSLWEAAMDDAGDITDDTVVTGSWDSCSAGTCDSTNLTDGEAVTWDAGSSGGTLIHITNTNGGSGGDQYLIDVTTGSLADNDEVTDGTNTFVVAGTPDSTVIITAECYDDDGVMDDKVSLNGLTTDADNYWKITVPDAEYHGGQRDTGFRIEKDGMSQYGSVISIADDYTVVEKVAISSFSGPDWQAAQGISMNVATGMTVRNCMVYGGSWTGASQRGGIWVGDQYVDEAYIYNNIIFNNDDIGINHQYRDGVEIYNNTVYNNSGVGISITSNDPSNIVKNNLSIDNGTDYSFGATVTHDYNGSSDTTADGTNSSTSVTNAVFTSVTTDAEDLTLVTAASVIGEGISQVLLFTEDIKGTDRGGTWDLGADQYATTNHVPLTTAFDMPVTTRTLATDITTWEIFVGGSTSITGYYLSESSTPPAHDAGGWVTPKPTSFTFSGNGDITVYAWAKNNLNEVSIAASDTVTVKSLESSTYDFWVNSGEDRVRQDEVRALDEGIGFYDEGHTINELWDGTNISIKEAQNAFAQFSVYIEAGANDLTNVTVEISDLMNGEEVIDFSTRTEANIFDFTQTDIELFYVRYLPIFGVRGGASTGDIWNAIYLPENRWEEELQRPNTGTTKSTSIYPDYTKYVANAGTVWEDRPGHNKYYPEILIPIELESTFDVSAGESQQIWTDIWIGKDVVAGTYTGTFTVKDDGVTIKTIPISLEVYSFELPDPHSLITYTWVYPGDFINRWAGERFPQSSEDGWDDAWMNFNQILRRHGIDLTDAYNWQCSFGTSGYRKSQYYMDGTYFTSGNGYNGPNIGNGPSYFVLAPYGIWRGADPYGIIDQTSASFTGTGSSSLTVENLDADDHFEIDVDFKVQIDGTGTPDTFKYSTDDGSTWIEETVDITGSNQYLYEYGDEITILGISKADPAVVTVANFPKVFDGKYVYISGVGGMTEITDGEYLVERGNSLDEIGTFKLDGVDSTEYTTFTSGGTAQVKHQTYIKFGSTTGHVVNDYWTFSPVSYDDAELQTQTYLDDCNTTIEALNPGMEKFLWLIDEPSTFKHYSYCNDASEWIHAATGGGENFKSYLTSDLIFTESRGATEVDLSMYFGKAADCQDRLDTQSNPIGPCAEENCRGYNYYLKELTTNGKEWSVYNSFPWQPYAEGQRTWRLFKDDIEHVMLWDSVQWRDSAGGNEFYLRNTDLWYNACTFGYKGGGESDGYGKNCRKNGDGVIVFPGTDVFYKEYTFDANSGTMENNIACTTDSGATTAICSYQDNDNNILRAYVYDGTFDDNDVVTDAEGNTVTLTGVEAFPDTNYDVDGVFAKVGLKNYRKNVQDYDYLTLAEAECESCVQTILTDVGVQHSCENILDWSNIYYGNGVGWDMSVRHGDRSFDNFERNRAKLANIILGVKPPSKTIGSLNGFSQSN